MTELARGQITDRPWGVTFGQLGLRELTGQLTVQAGDGRAYRVAFVEGAIVGATSPQPADAATRIAMTSGLISSSQVATVARQIAATPEIDEIALLAAACRLVPDQIAKLRRRVILQRAARTFSVEAGSYVVDDEITIPTAPDAAVDVRSVVYHGARLNLSELRLIAELRALGSHFTLGETAVDHAEWFGLDAQAMPVLDALRGGTTLPEIEARHRELDPRTVQSVIYALVACREVTVAATGDGVPHAPTSTDSGRAMVADSGRAKTSTTSGIPAPRPPAPDSGRTSTLPTDGISVSFHSHASSAPASGADLTVPRTETAKGSTAHALTPPALGVDDSLAAVPRTATAKGSTAHTLTPPAPPAVDERHGDAHAPTPPAIDELTLDPSATPQPAIDALTLDPRAAPQPGLTPPGPRTRQPYQDDVAVPRRTASPSIPPPIADPRRTASPSTPPPLAGRQPYQDDVAVPRRTASPSTPPPHADARRTASPSTPPPIDPQRTASPSTPPPITDPTRPKSGTAPWRSKSPTSPPLRPKSPSEQPAISRTASASGGLAAPLYSPGGDRVEQSIEEASAAFRRGVEALHAGQLPLAIEQLTRASTLNPHEFEHSALLAFAQLAHAPPNERPKLADKVRKMLTHASQKSREPAQSLVYLGQLERLLGNDKQALVHLRAALAAQPGHAQAQLELSQLEDKALEKSGFGLFRKK